jgi:poly(hydroxyalkanoate) depolymerase family esterase
MKRLFRAFLAACRTLWLGWLKPLAWPWRWLTSLLGAKRRADLGRAGEVGAQEPPLARKAREPVAPRSAHTTAARAGDASVERATAAADEAEAVEQAPRAGTLADLERVEAAEPIAPRKGATRPGQFSEGQFGNDAGQRDYKLYIPSGKPAGPLPLVVMLHGCKQDPDDFAAGTRMNQLADHQPMLVLYPGQSRSANGYGCWNWFNRHDQQRDAGEPSIIAGMIREVIARHPVDPRRVYAAGLSAGGAMATILAHTYPELLAAAGVHSGLPYAAAQDMITALGVMKRGSTLRTKPARAKPSAKGAAATAAVPLIVFHGDHDKTVHPLNGEHVVEQALESARAARPHDHGHPAAKAGRVPGGHAYTCTVYKDRAGQVQVEHWLVQGAGHAWSGGDAEGSFTDPLGPDASGEMLRFFLDHAKV